MIDVVKLASFIETKLNSNTKGLIFRTYTYEKDLDKRYEKIDGVKTNFIPSIITSPIGSYLPMNDVQGARLSFSVEILLPLSKKISWIDMLNDFVWSINGKMFYVGSDGSYDETYASGDTSIKMTCQVPSFGSISPQNFEVVQQVSNYLPIQKTEMYITINIPISLKTIKGFSVGDEAKIYLSAYTSESYSTHTYTKLKVSDFSIKNTKVPNTEHYYGDTTGETAIVQNDVKYIMTAYYEKGGLLDTILTDITTGSNPNKKYWLKLYLPNSTNPIYVKVIIFDNNIVFPMDEFSMIPLVFTKASKLV